MKMLGESSDQSILAVMNKFVQAVNVMDETVMIPMRLKDIPVESGSNAEGTLIQKVIKDRQLMLSKEMARSHKG